MNEEGEIEQQVIATPEQMLAAIVNGIVNGDVGQSQEIVDKLCEIKKEKRKQ